MFIVLVIKSKRREVSCRRTQQDVFYSFLFKVMRLCVFNESDMSHTADCGLRDCTCARAVMFVLTAQRIDVTHQPVSTRGSTTGINSYNQAK